MGRRLGTIAACLILLYGCASTPSDSTGSVEPADDSQPADEPGTGTVVTNPETDSNIVAENTARIAIATPESLEIAVLDLDLSDAAETSRGNEIRNVALEVFDILYPLLDPPGTISTPLSPTSDFVPIFEEVRAGRFPEVPQDKTSFLTLAISTLAVIATEDSAVLESCREALRQVAALSEESILPDLLLGLIAEREEVFDTAAVRYTSALATSGACYPAELGLARVELARGNGGRALEIAERLLATLPESAAGYELAARAYLADEQYDRAIEHTNSAFRLERDLRILILRAQIFVAAGSFDNADTLLKVLRDRRPTDPDVLLLTAEVQANDGALDEAIATITRATGLYPNNAKLRDAYGRLQILAGNSATGREILESSLGDSPFNEANLRVLLDDAVNSERWSDAADYIDRLLEIEERIDYLVQAVDVQSALENLEAAVEFAVRRYEREPENMEALESYAGLLIDLEREEEAEALLVAGIDTTDDNVVLSDFYYLRSLIADDRDIRRELLGRATFYNRSNFDAVVALARLLEESGDTSRARFNYKAALKLRPDDEEIQKKVDELTREQ